MYAVRSKQNSDLSFYSDEGVWGARSEGIKDVAFGLEPVLCLTGRAEIIRDRGSFVERLARKQDCKLKLWITWAWNRISAGHLFD